MNLLSLIPFASLSEPTTQFTGNSLSSQLANAIDCGDLGFVECLLDDQTYIEQRFAQRARQRGFRDIALALHRHMMGQDLHAPVRIV